MSPSEQSIITRHSYRPASGFPESPTHPGLSLFGVEEAKKKATSLKLIIEQSPPNSVFFIGGASDSKRTKSTADIYGDTLVELFKGDVNNRVITRSAIQGIGRNYRAVIMEISHEMDKHPNARFIVEFPLLLKQLSLRTTGIIDNNGNDTPYIARLMKANNGDEYKTVRQWIEEEEKGIYPDESPKPSEVAKGYIRVLNRLHLFSKKFTGDRPLIIMTVGHSLITDALLTYAVGGGKMTLAAFDKISEVGGEEDLIRPTEVASITLNNDQVTVVYRDKTYTQILSN